MPVLLSSYTGAYGASVVGVRGAELGAVNAPSSSLRNTEVKHGEVEEISYVPTSCPFSCLAPVDMLTWNGNLDRQPESM